MEETAQYTEPFTARFDVRKLVGKPVYWNGQGCFLVQHPQKNSALQILIEALTTRCGWQMWEGLVVDVCDDDSLTVHGLADFPTNIIVPKGQYLIVY